MYYGIYKCRLCGEKYMRCSVSNSKMVTEHFLGLVTPFKAVQQIDLIDMHSCEDGSFGLADFNGFVKQKNMDNNFFNFDAVVEIEKKKSYEQGRKNAIDECIEALGNNILDIAKLEQLKEVKNDI